MQADIETTVRLEVALKLIEQAGWPAAGNVTRTADPIVKYIMTGVVN